MILINFTQCIVKKAWTEMNHFSIGGKNSIAGAVTEFHSIENDPFEKSEKRFKGKLNSKKLETYHGNILQNPSMLRGAKSRAKIDTYKKYFPNTYIFCVFDLLYSLLKILNASILRC